MKIAICDDSRVTLEYMSEKIRNVLLQQKYSASIETFDNSEVFMKCIGYEFYDVIFLDVDMPNFSGFDIAKKLQVCAIVSMIIFISNLEESVYESLQFRPFRFIRKSQFEKEIYGVTEALIKALIYSKEHITITASNQQIRLDPNKIIYVECIDKTLKVVSQSKVMEFRYRLGDMESLLKEYGFIRIHKGYLVNYRCIASIKRNCEIVLESGERLPMSRKRVKEVFQEFARLV